MWQIVTYLPLNNENYIIKLIIEIVINKAIILIDTQ